MSGADDPITDQLVQFTEALRSERRMDHRVEFTLASFEVLARIPGPLSGKKEPDMVLRLVPSLSHAGSFGVDIRERNSCTDRTGCIGGRIAIFNRTDCILGCIVCTCKRPNIRVDDQ